MSRYDFRVFLPPSIVLILLTTAAVLRADVTGSILGVVHDRSQAVVAGAKVVATNVETNLSQETTSSAEGSYRILALPAGKYKLTVTAVGFRTFTETNIEVKVNDQLHFDVTLDVGTVTESVEISANAVQVQTENTQLGDVIDSKKMLALPLNGRSFIDLLGLQAGVAPSTAGTIGLPNGPGTTPDRPVSGNLNAGNISVNGQRETANAFLVNGADVSEGRNLGAGLVPNIDSIEEFRLITNSFDAEYGKFSGAVVNAITKSGTNGIHGDVFEFLRNDTLDAKNYFFAGKSELRRNQFGYAVGGPFWKNKLFWFTDYQGTREVSGAEVSSNVPTDAMRGGEFDPMAFTTTVTMNVNGTPTPVLVPTTIDGSNPGTCPNCGWAELLTSRLAPVTGQTVTNNEPYAVIEVPDSSPQGFHLAPCTSTAQCVFPVGANGLTLIPKAVWSGPATNILPFIPLPTPTAGCISTNYCNNAQKNRVVDDKAGQRVDFNNQKTGNWSWYYHYDAATASSAAPYANVAGFPSVTPSRAQQFVMSNTKNFGSTSLNEWRVSVFRTHLFKDNPAASFASLSALGFNNSNGLGIIPAPPPSYKQYVPQVSFSTLGLNLGVPTLNTNQPNTTYMVSDGFSKVVGRHTLKFGGEYRYLEINERNWANPFGGFVFNGTITGNDFADYLLGAPAASSGYTQAALQVLDSRTKYGGAYVQDSWKIQSNLTLNLGLRWEVSTPWYDTQGKIQSIIPGEQSVIFPLSPKGFVYPGDPGVPKTLTPTRYDNFAPRAGLAYSPGFSDGVLGKIFGGPGKTSIRASYGLYYTSIEDLNLFFEVADAPFGLYWSSGNVLFDEPFRNRRDGTSQGQRFPFSAPIPGSPANKTLSFDIYEPISFSPGYDPHNNLPYAEHFNLSIQRQLDKSTVLTLAYVGTGGHKLITSEEANPGDAALCLHLNAIGAFDTSSNSVGCGPNAEQDIFQLPGTTTSCLTATPNPGCVYGTRDTLLNPNYCPGPQTLCYSFGNTYTRTIANSIYNAGEITVERKAADMTFLAAYTFSKALDNSSAFGDMVNFVNPRFSRGLSSTDITHNFVASYVWAMPFDRLFKGAPKRLTQGWQMQGITRFSTGFPIPLNEGSDDISLAGSGSTDLPNRVGNPVIVDPRKSNSGCVNPNGTNTGCYFLPSAFAKNTVLGTFGTANRRFFHGPGFNNTDYGLLKRTAIKERMAFEIRGEFFNIFNHAQFNNPGGNIDGSSFGIVTSARPPRIGQVSAKFYW
jgi:Carboxypeptidase regulatory-like domain/TonB dependent receptor